MYPLGMTPGIIPANWQIALLGTYPGPEAQAIYYQPSRGFSAPCTKSPKDREILVALVMLLLQDLQTSPRVSLLVAPEVKDWVWEELLDIARSMAQHSRVKKDPPHKTKALAYILADKFNSIDLVETAGPGEEPKGPWVAFGLESEKVPSWLSSALTT